MFKKAIIGILLVLLALTAGMYLSLPFFVDKEAIKNEFITSFKEATGLDIEISGDVNVVSFPVPHVVMNSVYVHNTPGGISPFLLSIKLIDIYPAYTSLFGKRTTIGKINIDDVDIELEHLKSNIRNWQERLAQASPDTKAAHAGGIKSSRLVGTTISITNGDLRYLDELTSATTEFKDISVTLVNGGAQSDSTMNLIFGYKDKTINVLGRIGNIQHALSVGEMPAKLNIISGKSVLAYEGNAGYKDEKFTINGGVKFTTDDVGQWINTFLGTGEKTHNADISAEDAQHKLLPLEAKSSITTENGSIIFPDITLDGTVIKGGIRAELTSFYDVNLKVLINMLDMDALFGSRFFAHKVEKKPDDHKSDDEGDQAKNDHAQPAASDLIIAPKTYFNSLTMSADIKFDDIIYNKLHVKDSHIVFDTMNGEMTISQASASLPGDGRVIFAGIGKEGFQGFTLEGEMDATGDDFSKTMMLMKENGAAIPTEDFKRYKIKTNATLTSTELRMSELAGRIENIGIIGGLIATFGDRVKVVAALKIGGLNIDHFIQLWGIQEWRTSFFDTGSDPKNAGFLANWLKHLDFDVNANVSLEQFILNGLPRSGAEFKLTTTAGKLAFNDIKTEYNGTHLTGNASLDVLNPLPKIDVKLTADTFDTAVFFTADGKPAIQAPPPAAGAAPASRWSRQEFDFHWLDLLNLTFHLKFGDYKQGALEAQELTMQGSIDDRTLSIDSMTGIVLGARMASKLSIKGGKIPAINMAANITSLDPVRLVPFLPLVQGMTGKYNISLRLDTSGIDMFSWISSLEGTLGLGGAQVNIQGFNLAGVIHAVSYVRTVADILNVVKRAFPGGETMFNTIESQWTVANGVLRTANARLTNDQASGTLTSEVDLVNWQIQAVITLALRVLEPTHPPGMTITFAGNMDHPAIDLDTRSLEQYVTNKTSQQMLQQYGTH